MVNNYSKHGKSFRADKRADEDIIIDVRPESVRGMLTHIYWLKGREFKYRRFSEKDKEPEPGFVKFYRRFLDFNSFFDNDQPVILCEGKTDHIYLRCAIKNNAKCFPLLAQVDGEDVVPLVKFFKYGKHSLAVQKLGGGCGDLSLLIGQFSRRTTRFTDKKRKGPLIIVVDNDKAAKAVFSTAKEVAKLKENVDGSKDFYDLRNSVFLIAVPKNKQAGDFPIEYLFDKDLLKTKLNGKDLLLDDDFDENTHYGKYLFAEKIVRLHQDRIDFLGFKPLLDRISAAVQFDAGRGEPTGS